jgi:hypothetical protein
MFLSCGSDTLLALANRDPAGALSSSSPSPSATLPPLTEEVPPSQLQPQAQVLPFDTDDEDVLAGIIFFTKLVSTSVKACAPPFLTKAPTKSAIKVAARLDSALRIEARGSEPGATACCNFGATIILFACGADVCCDCWLSILPTIELCASLFIFIFHSYRIFLIFEILMIS